MDDTNALARARRLLDEAPVPKRKRMAYVPPKFILQLYQEQRQALLIELRLLRLTKPSKRVVKHMQRRLRKLRTFKRMMEEADE